MTNEECDIFFKKLFNDLNIAGMLKDKKAITDELKKDETQEDDMEDVIEWAKQQKQSLLNNKK